MSDHLHPLIKDILNKFELDSHSRFTEELYEEIKEEGRKDSRPVKERDED
jgi:hypothetical protein